MLLLNVLFVFSIGINCQAMDLSGKLLGLEGNLGHLKGKLGQLKKTLGKLKDGLEGKVQLDHLLEQRLLPVEFYGPQAEKKALEIQEKIINIAEYMEYGYKTANLMELQDICALVNKVIQENTGYSFAVPAFAQISSQQIQNFLNGKGLDVVDRWGKLIKEKFPDRENDLTTAIQNKQFPDGFLAGAKAIEDQVKSKFNSLVIGGQKLEVIISGLAHGQVKNLGELLAQVKKNDEKCMVRSTGKEDTDKLANAGGNESIANVSPETKNLLDAIRDVVASYFSAKSLTQRLGAGDKSIIDSPFTPVVIQRMIGEKAGMPLPRCGVMFTEETEGAQSKNFRKNEAGDFLDEKNDKVSENDIQTKARYRDENYKIITSGITVIQAAFGHNEGVVNSIVPVDTYYIENSVMLIHPIIKEKFFRIAPGGEGKLGRKDNTSAIAKVPVLEPDAVIALKLFANALEDYYKKPMDVEYVILNEGGIKTIYIVQARPIVHNPDQPDPCYLDFDHADFKSLEKNRGQAIGVGGGTLQFIQSKNNLVIKRTIGEALTAYQGNKNPQEIKSIFINEMAPATSHEATTFRSELKPVVSFENDFEKLEAKCNEEPANLILDAQQQTVIKWTGDFFDLASFEKNGRALKGWINYPLPQQVSVVRSYLPDKSNVYKNVNQFFFKTDSPPKDKVSDLGADLKSKSAGEAVIFLRQQIKEIKTGDSVSAQDALKNIWLFFHILPRLTGYEKNWDNLVTYAGLIILNLRENLSLEKKHLDYLSKRLFPIHFLETLLFQQHNDVTGLHGVSAIKLWSQMRLEKKGAESVSTIEASGSKIPEDEYARLAGVLGGFCLTENIEGEWGFFVNHLGTTGKSAEEIFLIEKLTKQRDVLTQQVAILNKPLKVEKKPGLKAALQKDLEEVKAELESRSLSPDDKIKSKFYQILKMLGELDMLEIWVNTSFAKKLSHSGFVNDYDQILKDVVQEADDAKDFLKTLLDYKKRIQAINVAGFENPATFLKNWEDFQYNVLSYFVGDGENDFIKKFVGIFDIQNQRSYSYNYSSYYNYSSFAKIKRAGTGTNDLGKLAALGVMEELITQFDTAIKAVTGSTLFGVYAGGLGGNDFSTIKVSPNLLKEQVVTHKDKIFTFHLMLDRYLELLQKWYAAAEDDGMIFNEIKDYGVVKFNSYSDLSIKRVLDQEIPAIFSQFEMMTKDVGELQAKIHAEGSAIGSQASFSPRLEPKTHEELFTFIHQSLLVVVSVFMKQYGVDIGSLPDDLKKIDQKICSLSYEKNKPSLVGTHFKNNIFRMRYNFPQRLHSALICLDFNMKTRKKLLTFSLFGANHNGRWEQCIDYVEFDNVKNNRGENFGKVNLFAKGFDVSWSILNNDDLVVNSGWLATVILDLCEIAGRGGEKNIGMKVNSGEENHCRAIIELSARYQHQRVFCLFDDVLNSKSSIFSEGPIIEKLMTIFEKLTKSDEYRLNSAILAYRLTNAPDYYPNKPEELHVFYNLTPANFYDQLKAINVSPDEYEYRYLVPLLKKLFSLLISADQQKILNSSPIALKAWFKTADNQFFKKLYWVSNDYVINSDALGKVKMLKASAFFDTNEDLLHIVEDAVFDAMTESVKVGCSWSVTYRLQWKDQSIISAVSSLHRKEDQDLLKELAAGALKRKDQSTKMSFLANTNNQCRSWSVDNKNFIKALLLKAGLDVSRLFISGGGYGPGYGT